jgi:hypothetical protein
MLLVKVTRHSRRRLFYPTELLGQVWVGNQTEIRPYPVLPGVLEDTRTNQSERRGTISHAFRRRLLRSLRLPFPPRSEVSLRDAGNDPACAEL